MGLNEFAGYFAVAGAALATGYVAGIWSLRPEPFYLGIGFVLLGLVISVFLVHETRHHADHEATIHSGPADQQISHGEEQGKQAPGHA